MSVLNAARPHRSIGRSTYVSTARRETADHSGDPTYRRDPPLLRWSRDWDDEFAAVVHSRLARLQRLARRILHGDDLADDAVQEALFSLWKEGRMPPNPEGWLVRAVVLRSLHLDRSRRRRRGYEERAGAQRPEHDPRGDASRTLEVKEVTHAVAAALGTLPEPLRVVFVLRTVEEKDYQAIARRLQIPLGTVRSRLSRSRRAIRTLLRPLLEDDDEDREEPE
jgi:RNA polymerase sigma-70 factor (ECF subfamily)